LLCFAWKKNLTVAKALQGEKWMQGLQRITSMKEVRQFITLWHKINEIELSDQLDAINWHLTASGNYSTSSAYAAHFLGACSNHNWGSVWAVKAEDKCKKLCWLLLQNKLWTADRILSTGGQSNPTCQLCRTYPENVMHMMLLCPFAASVWQGLKNWIGTQSPALPVSDYRKLKTRWASWYMTEDSQAVTQKVLYTMWNQWKERCRRVFDNKAMSASQLQQEIKNDVRLWTIARRTINTDE
jgi:hypothetical protein